ncbi:MAG: 30S ribosomal protein S6e [Candidatus Aenigmatarchaeota archaeon]
MANFKLVISDSKARKAYQKELEQAASGLLGKKIGDKVSCDHIGLSGYEIEITGGSDRQGFPMRADVEGTGRKKIILALGPGFHPKRKGQRRRKSIRGNTISADIVQVNAKVVKQGAKPIEQLLGKPKEEKPEEKKEAPKEEKPAEKPAEAKPEKPKEEKPAPKEEAKPEKKPAEKEEPGEQAEKAEKKMGVKKLE